ncbi:MAG: ATP-binding protein [Haloarculaceae archaeon]
MILPSLARLVVDYRPSPQTLHVGLFGAMTVLALGLAYWIHRTRRTRGAHLFATTLFLVGLRTGSDLLHGLFGELWTAQAVLVGLNPVLEVGVLIVFVRFAGRYASVESATSERAVHVLAGVLVAVSAVVVTDPIHGLVYTDFQRVFVPFTHVGVDRGIASYGIVALEGILLLVGAGLLAHAFTAGSRPAWWPSAVLSLGVSQAVLVGGLQLQGGGLLRQYDYVAIGLGGFVLLVTLALLDHGLRRIEVAARAAVLDDIEDAVVFLTDEGAVAEYNEAAGRLFPDIAPGVPFSEEFDEPVGVPRDRDATRTEVTLDRPAIESRHSASRLESDGGRAVHAQGAATADRHQSGPRDFIVETTKVTADTNEMLGYAVRFVDVTDLKERTRELQKKNERLEQFAATVSHDLRNPLNVATGYVEIVSNAADPDDDEPLDIATALTYLEKIDVSLDRMNAIIEDILALIEHADPVTDTEWVDFESVATAAWETVDTEAATLHIEGGGTIEADRDRLRRLLENLFRNAIDHVGEDVTIEVGLTDGEFYVVDDGPGIPEDDRDRIFEYGYTTGEGGTGLGLSIVSELAEAHGWNISLNPDADGACFVVDGCETRAAG